MRRHLGVRAERVRDDPQRARSRGVDRLATARRRRSAVRRRAGIGADEAVLLSVGRLEENKGFHVLAAALGALREHGTALQQAAGAG